MLKMKSLLWVVGALPSVALTIVVAAPPSLCPVDKHPTDSRRFTTGTFHGCPPWGKGTTHWDPWLDQLKNRDQNGGQPVVVSFSQILKLKTPKAKAMGKLCRSRWTAAAQKQVASREAKYVTISGYMVAAKDEGDETCNCAGTIGVDTHTWITAKVDGDQPTESIVAEVSPRMKLLHPNWRQHEFKLQLVKNKLHLRITGWMMWDQEHGSEVGKSRGTLWEVHPIHAIQFQDADGTWTDF
jgi:hypothetical protein